jgi:hypothetical protein
MLRVSHTFVLELADDDPESARAAMREAQAQWSHGKFLIQDWQVMRTEVDIDLYLGNGEAAYARLVRDERALQESLLLAVQILKVFTLYGRGRAAIASLATGGSQATRDARIAEAKKIALALRNEGMEWTLPFAAIVSACARNAEGDQPAAIEALREAVAAADAAEMSLHAAAARYQLGRALGGDEGAAHVRDAEDAMTAQDIRVPAKFASMFVPGAWG